MTDVRAERTRRAPRTRTVVAALAVLALLLPLAVVGTVWALTGLQDAANVAQVFGLPLAVPPLAGAVLLWARSAARRPDTPAATTAARPARSPVVVSAQVNSSVRVRGRADELRRMADLLPPPGTEQRTRPRVCVLAGMPGVGKSSLARAFAQEHLARYAVVWWIRAEDGPAAAGEFRTFWSALTTDDIGAVDPVTAVHARLAERGDDWLLVLDNVPGPAELRALLPPSGCGQVLVTTRDRRWSDVGLLVVDPLEVSPAADLLCALSGDDDRAAAEALAAELGNLPLALAQAGSYARFRGITLAGYHAEYRRRRPHLHRSGPPVDYDGTVETTWLLASDRCSAGARAVLRLVCWYAPDTIPVPLLLRPAVAPDVNPPALAPVVADDALVADAVGEIVALGLATRVGQAGEISLHRLTRAVTQDDLAARGEADVWSDAARAAVQAALPDHTQLSTAATLARWDALEIHARALVAHAGPDDRRFLELRELIAIWTDERGDPGAARAEAGPLLATRERLDGADHENTLILRERLAMWTGGANDPAGAVEQLAALVPDAERALGADASTTLHIRGEQVYWTGEAGDYPAARDGSAALLADFDRVFGADDLRTLTLRASHAWLTGEAGDPATARDRTADLLADATRVLGPDTPHVLRLRRSLARWTEKAGDPDGARAALEDLVRDCVRTLGADHVETFDVRTDLADLWWDRDGPAAALERLRPVLADAEAALGADNRSLSALRYRRDLWTAQLADAATEVPGT